MINRRNTREERTLFTHWLIWERLLKATSELQLGESRVRWREDFRQPSSTAMKQKLRFSRLQNGRLADAPFNFATILETMRRDGVIQFMPPISSSSPCRHRRLSTIEAASQSFCLLYQGNLGISSQTGMVMDTIAARPPCE